jgi:hypothetical protein
MDAHYREKSAGGKWINGFMAANAENVGNT